MLTKIQQKLFTPTDAASLGMFRILFGALMAWQAFYYLINHRYIKYYFEPSYHFTYDWFPFISPISQNFMFGIFVVMTLAAIGIMLGLFYRISVFIFWLTYSYVFLIDRAYFNNHYYAIILLSFILLCVNAQRWASLDNKLRPRPEVIPYWNLFMLKAQFFIIYIFGGIAKLNGDWLQGEPMRGWILKAAHLPIIGPWMTTEWAPYFFSWGGLAFDLSIGFLLWWRKTRFLAFLAVLFFNLMNSLIFSIGVFPFLMIAAATLFDDADWPRKFFKRESGAPDLSQHRASDFQSRAALAFLSVYFLIQVFLPLRHWLYPGDVSWTEEGHFFAWHMKLRDKEGKIRIWVTDPVNNSTFKFDPEQELNRFQMSKLVQRPQFIYQYVQHVKELMIARGIAKPVIRVDSWVSLNGRPFQQAIDPKVNLAEVTSNVFTHDPWILPLDPSLKPGTLPDTNPKDEGEKKGPRSSQGPLDR